mgnify:CR=1 FL=1
MMENDEILKRFEFLDAERRKDRQTITDLLEQISTLQETINEQKLEFSHLSTEVKKSTINLVRVDEFETALSQQKVDLSRLVVDLEKKVTLLEKKGDTQRKDDSDIFNNRLIEMQNEIKSINEIKKDVQTKIDNDFQTNQRINEIIKLIPDLNLKDEEVAKNLKLIEDNYKNESRRVTEIQVELTSLHKKMDESRLSIDSQREYMRKLEGQINDLVNREQVRNQEQISFIETQSRNTIDRDNFLKDWQEKTSHLEELSNKLQAQMLEFDNANKAVKQSLSQFDDLNQLLDRRLNEISEMSRLVEDRFRQEWLAFKADDQKRWTNFSLNQDENSRESEREMIKLADRITSLEDTSLKLVDSVHVINEETERRIKSILSVVNEILGAFERSSGKKG